MRNDSAAREVGICAVGFSLMLALNTFTLWGVDSILSSETAWPWTASRMRSWCLATNVLTFAAYGLAALRFPLLSRRRPTSLACALLALGSLSLLCACSARGTGLLPSGFPSFELAGVLLGSGGALAFVCWEFSLSTMGEGRAVKALLLASVLACVPYLLIVFLCGGFIMYPITLALVPACMASLLVAGRLIPEPMAAPASGVTARRGLRAFWGDAWPSLACIMMVGVIGPATCQFAMLGTMSDGLKLVLYQLANAAAAGVLALLWFGLRVRVTIPATFLVLTPLIVVSLFLFPFWNFWFQGFVLALGCFVFGVASILMMTLAIELARRHGVGLGVAYGVFAAFTYLAQIVGGAVAGVVGSSGYPRQFQVVAVMALLLWGLSAVALAVAWHGRAAHVRPGAERAAVAAPRAPGDSGVEGADAAGQPPIAEGGVGVADSIALACDELRERFDLTPREADVLEPLARGRDTGVIADALGVSRNTVRSHVQRLYASLDVHGRQELIDLVEATAAGLTARRSAAPAATTRRNAR